MLCATYPEKCMYIPILVFPLCCHQARIQKNVKSILDPKVQMQHPQNVSVCYFSHIRPALTISWKSVHLFFRNVANRHEPPHPSPPPPPKNNRKQNPVRNGLHGIFPKYCRMLLVPSPTYPEIWWKSVHPFFPNVANRRTYRQTVRHTKPTVKGENINFAVRWRRICSSQQLRNWWHVYLIWFSGSHNWQIASNHADLLLLWY